MFPQLEYLNGLLTGFLVFTHVVPYRYCLATPKGVKLAKSALARTLFYLFMASIVIKAIEAQRTAYFIYTAIA